MTETYKIDTGKYQPCVALGSGSRQMSSNVLPGATEGFEKWRGTIECMGSAERKITGVWGLCPQRSPGAEPLNRGQKAKHP